MLYICYEIEDIRNLLLSYMTSDDHLKVMQIYNQRLFTAASNVVLCGSKITIDVLKQIKYRGLWSLDISKVLLPKINLSCYRFLKELKVRDFKNVTCDYQRIERLVVDSIDIITLSKFTNLKKIHIRKSIEMDLKYNFTPSIFCSPLKLLKEVIMDCESSVNFGQGNVYNWCPNLEVLDVPSHLTFHFSSKHKLKTITVRRGCDEKHKYRDHRFLYDSMLLESVSMIDCVFNTAGLFSLKVLFIQGCKFGRYGGHFPEYLKTLTLVDCKTEETIFGGSNLISVTIHNFSGNFSFSNCANLETLEIVNAPDILNLCGPTSLKTLKAPKCDHFHNDAFMDCARLETLDISETTKIPCLDFLLSLKTLIAREYTPISFSTVMMCRGTIEELDIHNNWSFETIECFPRLKKLVITSIANTPVIYTISLSLFVRLKSVQWHSLQKNTNNHVEELTRQCNLPARHENWFVNLGKKLSIFDEPSPPQRFGGLTFF